MKTKKEFEIWLEKQISPEMNILAIGETNMNFQTRYCENINEFRFHNLRKINENIVGIDINNTNVKNAIKKGYNFIHCDIENTKKIKSIFKKKKFDLIIMLNVIEHLSNTSLALQNIEKLLSKNGKAIIMTDSPFYIRQFWNRIIQKDIITSKDHTCFITPENMKQLVKRNKLLLQEVQYVHMINDNTLSKIFINLFGRINPYFLDNFIYIITKK